MNGQYNVQEPANPALPTSTAATASGASSRPSPPSCLVSAETNRDSKQAQPPHEPLQRAAQDTIITLERAQEKEQAMRPPEEGVYKSSMLPAESELVSVAHYPGPVPAEASQSEQNPVPAPLSLPVPVPVPGSVPSQSQGRGETAIPFAMPMMREDEGVGGNKKDGDENENNEEDEEEEEDEDEEEEENENENEDEDENENENENEDENEDENEEEGGFPNKRPRRIRQTSRRLWSEEEDKAIRRLVEQYGLRQWTLVSKKLQCRYGIEGRSGKQCRER
jgi:hypothetical protein